MCRQCGEVVSSQPERLGQVGFKDDLFITKSKGKSYDGLNSWYSDGPQNYMNLIRQFNREKNLGTQSSGFKTLPDKFEQPEDIEVETSAFPANHLIPVSEHSVDADLQDFSPHPVPTQGPWYGGPQYNHDFYYYQNVRQNYQPFYPHYGPNGYYPPLPAPAPVMRNYQYNAPPPYPSPAYPPTEKQKGSSHSKNSNSEGSYHMSPNRSQLNANLYYPPQKQPKNFHTEAAGGAEEDYDYYQNYEEDEGAEKYTGTGGSNTYHEAYSKNPNKTNIDKYRTLVDNNASQVLIVKGLEGSSLTSEVINSLFSNFGNVSKLLYFKQKATAYIEFPTKELASIAKEMLNNLVFFGHQMKVTAPHPDQLLLSEQRRTAHNPRATGRHFQAEQQIPQVQKQKEHLDQPPVEGSTPVKPSQRNLLRKRHCEAIRR